MSDALFACQERYRRLKTKITKETEDNYEKLFKRIDVLEVDNRALQKENEELREVCRMISNELIYLSPEIAEKYGETIDRLLGGEK